MNMKVKCEQLSQNICLVCNENKQYMINWHHADPSKKKYTMSSIWNRDPVIVISEAIKTYPVCNICHTQILHTKNNNNVNEQELLNYFWEEHLEEILDSYYEEVNSGRSYLNRSSWFKDKLCKYMAFDQEFKDAIEKFGGLTGSCFLLNSHYEYYKEAIQRYRNDPIWSDLTFNFRSSAGHIDAIKNKGTPEESKWFLLKEHLRKGYRKSGFVGDKF